MSSFLLALDQGTTSSRAILFNQTGGVVAVSNYAFAQHFPQPGWVEHDPEDLWKSQTTAARTVIRESGIAPFDIAGIGIANQRETTLLWDRNTGQPVPTPSYGSADAPPNCANGSEQTVSIR